MPTKHRRVHRKGKKSARRRKVKRALKFEASAGLVRYIHHLNPFPPRFQTSFFLENLGSWAATAIPAAGARYAVEGNGMQQPLNVPTLVLPYAATYAANLTYPIGWHNLANSTGYNNVYTRYKVISCNIKFQLMPANPLDAYYVSMVPYPVNGGSAATGYITASNDINCVKTQFRVAEPDHTLNITIKPWKIFGVTKKAYMSDQSSNYSADTALGGAFPSPAQLIYNFIFLESAILATNTSPVGFRIALEWEVELYNYQASNLLSV